MAKCLLNLVLFQLLFYFVLESVVGVMVVDRYDERPGGPSACSNLVLLHFLFLYSVFEFILGRVLGGYNWRLRG